MYIRAFDSKVSIFLNCQLSNENFISLISGLHKKFNTEVISKRQFDQVVMDEYNIPNILTMEAVNDNWELVLETALSFKL